MLDRGEGIGQSQSQRFRRRETNIHTVFKDWSRDRSGYVNFTLHFLRILKIYGVIIRF